MKKSTCLVLVFAYMLVALFVNGDAWEGVNEDGDVRGGEEKLTTPKANYNFPTLSRKLIAFGGSSLVPDSGSGADIVSGIDPGFNFGSGSNIGSGSSIGSNTDLVPDANPGTGMVSSSNPGFNFGSGSSMGSGSNSDLVPDTNPATGSVSGSNPNVGFGSGWNSGSGSSSGSSSTNRIGSGGAACSELDIEVDQHQTAPLPNGIPTYTVIVNNLGNTPISDIHLSCGWFSSFTLVDPAKFQRIAYNDCLLLNGGTLNVNDGVSFVYADTYAYPLAVSSVTCNN